MRYHHTPMLEAILKTKNLIIASARANVKLLELSNIAGGESKMVQYDSAIPHLGIYRREMKVRSHKSLTLIFIAALFIITKAWR